MKVSWQWLSQIFDLSWVSPTVLVQSLTIAGFEVESIQIIEIFDTENTVLDIVTIPNRSDLSNIIGIVREIAMILQHKLVFYYDNLSFLYNTKSQHEVSWRQDINYINHILILMSDLRFKQSPQWIQSYLIFANIKPINSIIDIKNYIKLKWGQDLEILGIAELNTGKYKSYINLSILTQHNFKVSLSTGKIDLPVYTILIKASIPINKLTKNGQNIDQATLYHAVQESLLLYEKYCSGSVQNYRILNLYESFILLIKVTQNNLIRILGPIIDNQQSSYISKIRITEVLNLLNLNPLLYSTFWLVTIPRYRYCDLKREIDIIEEVARIYGLNYFNDTLPYIFKKNKISQRELLKRQFRSFLRNVGLNELVHSSLQKKQDINILNPLSDEYNGLRYNLVLKLIQSSYYNICQRNSELNGFEVGKIFYIDSKTNILHEQLHLGVIWSCKNYLRSEWSNKPNSISWFQAKGMLSNLCQSIGINLSWKKINPDSYLKQIFHPQRTASLYLRNQKVGLFGEINPKLFYNLGTKNRFYAFELDLDNIFCQIKNSYNSNYQLELYSKYPYVIRDISIIVPKDLNMNSIISLITSLNNSLIKSVELFDEYSGSQIPLNKRSMSLRLKYQSHRKTLTNQQIIQLDNSVRDIIQKKLRIKIRL